MPWKVEKQGDALGKSFTYLDFESEGKSLFSDALRANEMRTWELWNAVQAAAQRIAEAARSKEVTGTSVDVAAKVKELVSDYAGQLGPTITTQINDYLSSDQKEPFYLKAGDEPPMNEDTDALVIYGGAVKALGGGRVGGYGVLFTSASDPDLQGDFFTKATDLELDGRDSLRTLWDHGLDPVLKRKKLERAKYRKDDVGIWFETKLNEADDYEKAIYGLAKAGKLGWSTGSAPHLVERVPVKKAFELKSWPISEVSLTHMPVEPRTAAVPLKAIAHVGLKTLLERAEAEALPPFSTKALEEALAAAYDNDLENHSLKVATAVEELIAHYAKTATALNVLNGRLGRKQEFRFTKDGRAISKRRAEKMQELADLLDQMPPNIASISQELRSMAKLAEATREQHDALAEAIQLQHNTFQQLKESQNHA